MQANILSDNPTKTVPGKGPKSNSQAIAFLLYGIAHRFFAYTKYSIIIIINKIYT